MLQRIKSIQNSLSDSEAFVIISDINRLYFTGFSSSAGTLLITRDAAEFFIDFRYYEKAVKSISHCEVILAKNVYQQLGEALNRLRIREIYIETSQVTLQQFSAFSQRLPDFKFSDSDKMDRMILQLRSKKSSAELARIKAAQRITDDTFSYILNHIRPGRTEREIMLEMEYYMRKQGGEGVSFDTIVVSGKNSSLPHGVPTAKTIEKGDFITMDFGTIVDGYCSDMTRTVAVGEVNDLQLQVYNTVLSAQEKALSGIAPGKVCKDIDGIARSYITQAGFGDCFGHGLGHSVGLEVHESPSFNTSDETPLEPGMVLTVEPGIYLSDQFGVRIEDMVYITESGFENLTASPKELIII